MNAIPSDLRGKLDEVMKRVGRAAAKSGRKPSDITVVAVTKTVPADRIREAIALGITDVGENRVQELCEKYDIIGGGCRWHLIGHLQTNKVKYVIDKVSMIHSADSLELLSEIQKRAAKGDRIVETLLQVNVSGEESKFGISPADVPDFLRKAAAFKNIKVKGLMTIAPLVDDPEEVRGIFRGLHKIFIDIKKENIDNIDMAYLSMGMSGDFEVAIEEGANIIRIGSAIFGGR